VKDLTLDKQERGRRELGEAGNDLRPGLYQLVELNWLGYVTPQLRNVLN